ADLQAPVTAYFLDGHQLSDGSYLGSVSVSLSATDDHSGVDKTVYRVNGGDWMDYSEPFAINADGTATLEFYSIDREDNVEKTQKVMLDVTSMTFEHLYGQINRADISPSGLKTALTAHVRSAERARNIADRNKHLQKALDFVENLSAKHISPTAKNDLKAFIQAMLNN
ncbi:MAG: OmpL47-type beta-barrel domain-containing protein, partial [Tuberibacillus sp.]